MSSLFQCRDAALVIVEQHRLYQAQAVHPAPKIKSLVEHAAQTLSMNSVPQIRPDALHLLPDHLLERIACYDPDAALTRPIRQVVAQRDALVWPAALRIQHLENYLRGIDAKTKKDVLRQSLDAGAVQASATALFRVDARNYSAELLCAHIDLGRILFAETTRQRKAANSFWRRVLRFVDTPHGVDAPPARAPQIVGTHALQSQSLSYALRLLWSHIAQEFVLSKEARPAFEGAYTKALRHSVWLAPLWDYDLLRLSVTEGQEDVTRRRPSRFLPALRKALAAAADKPDTNSIIRLQLVQLEEYVGVFDIPYPRRAAHRAPDWQRDVLVSSFSEIEKTVKKLKREKPHFEKDGPKALLALWSDTQELYRRT